MRNASFSSSIWGKEGGFGLLRKAAEERRASAGLLMEGGEEAGEV